MIDILNTVLGGVFTALIGAIAYFYRKADIKRERESKTIAKLSDAFVLIRAEMKVIGSQLNSTITDMTKLDGKLDILSSELSKNTHEMVRVQSKLDAVFRYIDAPKQKTGS